MRAPSERLTDFQTCGSAEQQPHNNLRQRYLTYLQIVNSILGQATYQTPPEIRNALHLTILACLSPNMMQPSTDGSPVSKFHDQGLRRKATEFGKNLDLEVEDECLAPVA